jgi:hypothetical protein
MKIHEAVDVLNEARMLVRPGSAEYTVERIFTSAAAEERLAVMYIASLLEERGPVRRRAADMAALNRAVTALKHFAVDGGEPCDYLHPSLLAGTPAGIALCWFDTDDKLRSVSNG